MDLAKSTVGICQELNALQRLKIFYWRFAVGTPYRAANNIHSVFETQLRKQCLRLTDWGNWYNAFFSI